METSVGYSDCDLSTEDALTGRPWKPEDVSLPRFPEFGIKEHEEAQTHSTFAASIAGWKWLSSTQQTYSFGLASLASLPNISADQPSMTAYISEGLHFRGGSRKPRTVCLVLSCSCDHQRTSRSGEWSGSFLYDI